MKYLAIDFGTRRIGIAISNEEETIAFPKVIIANNNKLIQKIIEIINNESIKGIIIGESTHLDGSHNPLMGDIELFIKRLRKHCNLPIHLEKEWMSSIAARTHFYGKGNIAYERWSGKENQKKKEAIDSGAAAIILQRFLDKK